MNCTECLDECWQYIGCIEGIVQQQMTETILILSAPFALGFLLGAVCMKYYKKSRQTGQEG